MKRHPPTFSVHRYDTDTLSSSPSASGDFSGGGASTSSGSYAYYYEGSGSWSPTALLAVATTAANSTSDLGSSSTSGFSDVLIPSSAYLSPAVLPNRALAHSAATPRVSIVGLNSTPSASGFAVSDCGGRQVGAARKRQAASAATVTSTSDTLEVDDTNAVAHPPQLLGTEPSPLPSAAVGGLRTSPAALAPVTHGADDVSPTSTHHFSEVGPARCSPPTADLDAATHRSGEGGSRDKPVLNVLSTILTVPITVPLAPEDVERRREEGGLSYPSHLTLRMVPRAQPVRPSGSAVAEDRRRVTGKGGDRAGSDAAAVGVTRAPKTVCLSCGFFFTCCSERAKRKTEDGTARRQRPKYNLRSHHVPLVGFRTTREPSKLMRDTHYTLPRVDEAAVYRSIENDVGATDAHLKRLQRAVQQGDQRARSKCLETSSAFGSRTAGGPDMAEQSAFFGNGDWQGHSIVYHCERPQVCLEPIDSD
ncbi:hypothetical protein JKF63_07117 [Porcisia hertigi]|uniref:Uncharacterized protein n=1 Tax=Porcisia hertigi TaxID=2761500 RepID=A0A836LKD1_9TRYP|nr:hypothetical protein JKF63_07117 [Porcisia hertigi]